MEVYYLLQFLLQASTKNKKRTDQALKRKVSASFRFSHLF
jgi:hypothetical protein